MSRWKAAAIHLALSAVLLGSIAAFALWSWYPPGLMSVAKADKLLLILTGVDVTLGPLLTLIVYRQGKKSLKFDLTVIALMQVAALAFGLNTMWQSRPVYLVAATDRFQLVFANEIAAEDLKRAAPGYERLPLVGIRTIAARLPQEAKRRERALLSSLSGKDIYLFPENYVNYGTAARGLAQRGVPVTRLRPMLSAEDGEALDAAIRRAGSARETLVAVPIDSARGSATMLLEAGTGVVKAPAAVDLWPVLQKTRIE